MSDREHRPLRVTLFAWLLAAISAWNALRLLEALLFWRILAEYRAEPGPLYVAASGALWLVCGVILIPGWLKGRTWAWPAGCAFAPGYALWYWLDRLLAQGPRPSWPFALGLSLALLALAGFSLLSRPTLRYFHREPHERKPKTPTSPRA
jgi:hypothetical protein